RAGFLPPTPPPRRFLSEFSSSAAPGAIAPDRLALHRCRDRAEEFPSLAPTACGFRVAAVIENFPPRDEPFRFPHPPETQSSKSSGSVALCTCAAVDAAG